MLLREVLERVVADGIALDGGTDGRGRGATDGYRACLDREPDDLREIAMAAAERRMEAVATGRDEDYHRAYEEAVDRVAAVMSCAFHHLGLPTIARRTGWARLRYAAIVGFDDVPMHGNIAGTKR